MALLESKKNSRLMSAVSLWSAALALALLSGCSEKDSHAVGGNGAAGGYESTPLLGGVSSAYWAVDRVEEDAAVLENPETSLTEERPVKDLPAGVREGQVLADDGALRIDLKETAARAARITERFERLKAD
jgi:hypothetical protein